MTDPIADMLTRIRNAVRSRHPRVDIPHSKLKVAIAGILRDEGYVATAATVEKDAFKVLRLTLRYDEEGEPLIDGLSMVSKPGRRVYAGYRDIPAVMGGVGLSIVSTPRGLLTGREARRRKLGGEILCNVW